MAAITVEEFQRDFGSFLRQVRNGARLLILDADRPVAELRPIADPRPAKGTEQSTLEPEIQRLYGELRELVARSVEDPSLGPEIDRARDRLQGLQLREVELMEKRAASRLHFDPAEGERLLEWAESLLDQ